MEEDQHNAELLSKPRNEVESAELKEEWSKDILRNNDPRKLKNVGFGGIKYGTIIRAL